jgi:RHS repeat-associated protein
LKNAPLVTTFVYDGQDRLTQTIGPDGKTNEVVFDELGHQQSSIDALGRTTGNEYDARANLVRVSYPDLSGEGFAYDAERRRIFQTNQLGHVTQFIYDALGRVTHTIFPDATTNVTVYDAAGRVATSTDARGVTTAYGYDAAGRRTSLTNALGTPQQQVTRYAYDSAGNLTNVVDALGRATDYEYDAMNRQVKVIYPATVSGQARATMTTGYDGLGRRVAETNEASIIRRFGYDGLGRLIAATNAWGTAEVTWATFGYDEVGNQVTQTDALGRVTRFDYDKLGHRTRRVLPGGQVESFAYDVVGNLLAHTNFAGLVVTNEYDSRNRLFRRWAGSTLLESYNYSASGRRISRTDQSGSYAWGYDNRDRVRTNTTPVGALYYQYDAIGNLTNVASGTANGLSVSYAFDALNRLTNAIDQRLTGAKNTAYTFDPIGNLKALKYPNGATNLWEYDARNRLTNEIWKLNTTALGSFFYQLGLAGNRTSLSENLNGTSRTYTWGYDGLYRLTNEIVSGLGSMAYSYDRVSNRTNRSGALGPLGSAAYGYNTNDWLTTDTYDANGNTLNSASIGYTYDWANRLTNANNGGVVITYNADNHRIKKVVGGTTTLYLVDANNLTGYPQPVEEFTVSGGVTNLSRVYTYGLDLISQRQASGPVHFYGTDGHGSVRFLADTNGAITDTYTYDAYGCLIASNGTAANLYRYTGEQFDPDLGFYVLGPRYLNPNSGRFWTMDSFEGNAAEPLSLHKYLYVHADPVNGIDPSGHEFSVIGFQVASAMGTVLQSMYDDGVLNAGFAIQDSLLDSLKQYTVTELFMEALDLDESLENAVEYVAERLRSYGASEEDAEAYAFREYFDFSALPMLVEDEDYVPNDLDEQEPLCFVAGTKVWTPYGWNDIEQMRVGDEVWTYDLARSNVVSATVSRTFIRNRDTLIKLRIDEDVVETTPEHPFFVKGSGWTRAERLHPDDSLLTFDAENEAYIREIETQTGQFTVYNFEVPQFHNYFVTYEGVLVHNIGGGYHHYATVGLGSKLPYGHRILRQAGKLPGYEHASIHVDLNIHLRTYTRSGKTMMPARGNPGKDVRRLFTRSERLSALRTFYKFYRSGKYYPHFQRELKYIAKNPRSFR